MIRYVATGTWSRTGDTHYVEVVSEKRANKIKELGYIDFTDGTTLHLRVRMAAPRERG